LFILTDFNNLHAFLYTSEIASKMSGVFGVQILVLKILIWQPYFTAKHDKRREIRELTRHETDGDWNRTSWRAAPGM